MAQTRAQKNRAIRQEALREQLSQGKHVEHVIDIAKKLGKPEGLTSTEISGYKAAADIRLKLIEKYLPGIKAIELSGEGGSHLLEGVAITFHEAPSKSPE